MTGAWRLAVAGAWAATALGITAIVAAALVRIDPSLVAAGRPSLAGRRAGPAARYPAESLAAAVVARDLFRFGRRPAPTRYDPQRAAAALAGVTLPPKPTLVLLGIVSAPEPTAVIAGLPGVQGPRVVRVGEHIGEFQIRAIRGAEVRVAGMDTAWTLIVREPWNAP